jgi:autotransporter-associated beta strand protein
MHYRVALLAILTCAVVWATTARAQTTYVWNDTNTSWTTAADWTPNGPADWFADPNITNVLAKFPGQATINNQPNVDNNIFIAGITIDDSLAAWNITRSFGVLNIGASGLTVIGPTPTVDSMAGATPTATTTISPAVNLSLDQTWTIGQGVTVAVTNSISGSGNLTVAGPGKLVITGNNTITGTITVTSGVTAIGGNQSAATGIVYGNGGAVQLANGAVLGGDLHLGPNTSFQANQGGTAAAQTNSPNLFGDSEEATIMGNLIMDQGTPVEFDIDGPDPQTGYDRVNVDKDITIGDADLYMVEGDFTPTIGEAFFIIDNEGNESISGQFTNAPEGSIITAGGVSYMITYDADADTGSLTGGNDVALVAVALPEPAGGFGLAAAVMLIGRRSRRKNSADLPSH